MTDLLPEGNKHVKLWIVPEMNFLHLFTEEHRLNKLMFEESNKVRVYRSQM